MRAFYNAKRSCVDGEFKSQGIYLGGLKSWGDDSYKEATERIKAMRNSWASMGKFWHRACLGLRSKIRVFDALVNSTVLSGATAAIFTKTDLERMEKARTG